MGRWVTAATAIWLLDRPPGRDGICCRPLLDVAARMVALAYHQHRTVPEPGQFADLVTPMLTAPPGPERSGLSQPRGRAGPS